MSKTFIEIFPTEEHFQEDFSNSPFSTALSSQSVNILYGLLIGRFENSHIANESESQFKSKAFGIMWQYGPTWQRNVEIQKTFRELSEEDLISGAFTLNNNALNPSTELTGEVLTNINQQSTQKYKKSKMEAYGMLASLLEKDVTEAFISKFSKLFVTIISTEIDCYIPIESPCITELKARVTSLEDGTTAAGKAINDSGNRNIKDTLDTLITDVADVTEDLGNTTTVLQGQIDTLQTVKANNTGTYSSPITVNISATSLTNDYFDCTYASNRLTIKPKTTVNHLYNRYELTITTNNSNVVSRIEIDHTEGIHCMCIVTIINNSSISVTVFHHNSIVGGLGALFMDEDTSTPITSKVIPTSNEYVYTVDLNSTNQICYGHFE